MLDLAIKLLIEKNRNKTTFEHISALSEARFRRILKYVLTKSAFYMDYYASHGITVNDLQDLKLADLPFTNKQLLMDHFNQVGCDPMLNQENLTRYVEGNNDYASWYLNKYKIIKTSGSSGQYGFFPYNRREWNTLKATTVLMNSVIKPNPLKKIKLAVIVDTRGMHAGVSLMADIPDFLYDILVIDIYEKQTQINDKLNAFQPDVISGYTHGIYLCALEQLSSRISIQPLQVGCSGEKLIDEVRSVIAQAFQAPVTNLYAASESICIASSTPTCPHLHIAYDWNLIESVDDNNHVNTGGQIGNAVLTNLYNYSFPLIRYRMNDRIAMHLGSCPYCKSAFPVITTIEGRSEEYMKFIRADGSEEFLSCSIINLFDEPGIIMFRILQKERNFVEFQLVLSEGFTAREALLDKLNQKIKGLIISKNLENTLSYHFVLTDDIKRSEITGKFKYIITFEDFLKDFKEEKDSIAVH